MPLATYRSFLGIAKEATKGTALAATDFIPLKTLTPFDHITYLEDKNMRGSMVETYGEIAGPIWSEFEIGGDVFSDTIGYPMHGVLGDYSQSGSTPTNANTLNGATIVGATTAILTSATGYTASAYVQIDTGAVQEVRKIVSVATNTLTLDAPLQFAHANAAVTNVVVAPFTHNFAVKNATDGQPGSFTFTDYDGFNARQFAGMQFEELALKFNADGLLEFTSKAQGFASQVGTTPTPSYSTVIPLANWSGVTQIAGVATGWALESGELTIKRPVVPIHAIDGTQGPYRIWAGPVSASGKLTIIAEDDTQLTAYLTNTQPSLDVNWVSGTNVVNLHSTKTAFTVGKVVRGKEYVQQEIDFVCVANTTDAGGSGGYSPCKLKLVNAKGSSVFGN